jgi:hypothetical protein
LIGIVHPDHAAAGVQPARFHHQRKTQRKRGAHVIVSDLDKGRAGQSDRLLLPAEAQFVGQRRHGLGRIAWQLERHAQLRCQGRPVIVHGQHRIDGLRQGAQHLGQGDVGLIERHAHQRGQAPARRKPMAIVGAGDEFDVQPPGSGDEVLVGIARGGEQQQETRHG